MTLDDAWTARLFVILTFDQMRAIEEAWQCL